MPAAARADRRYRLRFGAVDGCCRVRLDDREIGAQLRPTVEMWNLPFEFDIGSALGSGWNHRFVVQVVEDRAAAGFCQPVRCESVALSAPPWPRPVRSCLNRLSGLRPLAEY